MVQPCLFLTHLVAVVLCSTIVPGVLQVECHPYLNQSKLQEFCKSKDIILTAYGALGTDFRKEW